MRVRLDVLTVAAEDLVFPAFSVEAVEVDGTGDRAHAWYAYRYEVEGETEQGTVGWEEEGQWIQLVHRGTDGAWRIHRDIWNRDAPLE